MRIHTNFIFPSEKRSSAPQTQYPSSSLWPIFLLWKLPPVRLRLKIRSLRPEITVWSVSRSSSKVLIVKFSISRVMAFLLLVLVEVENSRLVFWIACLFAFSQWKLVLVSNFENELYELFDTMIVFYFFGVILLGFAWLGFPYTKGVSVFCRWLFEWIVESVQTSSRSKEYVVKAKVEAQLHKAFLFTWKQTKQNGTLLHSYVRTFPSSFFWKKKKTCAVGNVKLW